MGRSIHKELTGIISYLLIWTAVGWTSLPFFYVAMATKLDLEVNLSRVEFISFTATIFTLSIALILLYHSRSTTLIDEATLTKRVTYSCPHCGHKISLEDYLCPHCRAKLPR